MSRFDSRFRPRWTCVFLVTVAVLLLGGRLAICLGPQPEVEPNDTPATATPLTPETFDGYFFGVPGSIWPAGDVDYFQIPAQAGSRLWLLVDTGGTQHPAGTSRDSILEVLAPDGTTVLEMDDDDGTGNGHGYVISSLDASAIAGLIVPTTATYLLRVTAKNTGDVIAPYVLMVAMTTLAPEPEYEPNDTAPGNTVFGPPVLGSLSTATDVDWYDCALLDSGVPFVAVDGDPERDGTWTDVLLDIDPGSPPLPQVNSSTGPGSPPPPAEALVLPTTAWVRVTGPAAGTYMITCAYTGDYYPVPVELQSFRIE